MFFDFSLVKNCADDWRMADNVCVRLSDDTQTFTAAQAACAAMATGARLAEPRTPGVNHFYNVIFITFPC